MRLLRVADLCFEDVPSHGSCPEYAILSHTWIHPSDNEVSLQDMLNIHDSPETVHQKAGWTKLMYLVNQAKRSNKRYVWMDTCCIDQRNPTELTEAINCMFNWYSRATVCYVYLSDVELVMKRDSHFQYLPETSSKLTEALRQCKWIQRGWTLQELIAPTRIVFFSKSWSFLMGSADSPRFLAQVTGIDADMLAHKRPLYSYSIAQRLSWASNRMTTFPEDRAYSLVGLFGITMATHYGEGEHRAFMRLQEEIVKISTDQSLFAWNGKDGSLLAQSLDCFKDRGHVVPRQGQSPVPYHIDNIGLQINLCAGRAFAILDCRSLGDPSVVFLLRLIPGPGGHFMLDPVRRCEAIDWRALRQREKQDSFPRRPFSIRKSAASYDWSHTGRICDSSGPWHLKLRLPNVQEEKEALLYMAGVTEEREGVFLAGVTPSKDWIRTSANSFYYRPSSIWELDGPLQGAAICIRWHKPARRSNQESATWQYGVVAFAYGRRSSYTTSTWSPPPVLYVQAISETRVLEDVRSYVRSQAQERLRNGILEPHESLPLTRSIWCRQESRLRSVFFTILRLQVWQQVRVTLDRAEIAGETFWELDVALPRNRNVFYFIASTSYRYFLCTTLKIFQWIPRIFHGTSSWLKWGLQWSWYWLLVFNEWSPLATTAFAAWKLDVSGAILAFPFTIFVVGRDKLPLAILGQIWIAKLVLWLPETKANKHFWLWLRALADYVPLYETRTLPWSRIWRWLQHVAWWSMQWLYDPEDGFTRLGNTFLVTNLALLVYFNWKDIWKLRGRLVVLRSKTG